jgi:predicted PurR-regulated permease PerM
MKRFALQVSLVFATVAVAVLLWQFREAILLFALALATVATLRPAVDFLVARRIRRSIALALTCLGAVAVAALLLAVLGAPLLSEAQRAANELLRAYDRASDSQVSLLRRLIVERLPASAELYRALGSQIPGSGAQAALGITRSALELTGRAVVVLAMGVYWLANRDAFEHWGLSLLSSEWRVRTRETWRAAKVSVGAHLRSQLAQSLLAIVILDLGFHALGLRFPTLPAVACGLARLVPVVGIPFAVLSAVLVGLANGPVEAACAGMLAAATFLLIALAGARAFPLRRNNAILEIVTMVALADAYGVPGLFAAAPVAAAIHIVGERLLFSKQSLVSADLRDVARRLVTLRKRIDRSSSAGSAALAGVVDRLDRLIDSAQRLESLPWRT